MAVNNPHGHFDAALKAYKDARAYFDGLPLDDPQESAALDAWCDALDHLILNVPAPDGEALATKMEMIGDRVFSMDWIPACIADARRLSPTRGVGGSPA